MPSIDTKIVQKNILGRRQFSTSVTEYIASSDRKTLTNCFDALPTWFDKIKNTGLIVQNLEDFVKIILDKETGVRKHLETTCLTNSKNLQDNFKQLKYSFSKLESYKFAVRAIDQRYQNSNRYKNTEVEEVILAWCFENNELVKPFFDYYVNKFKNVESIYNSIITDPRLEIVKPLISELKPVFEKNQELFLDYENDSKFERFIFEYNDPDLAYEYCDLQEYVETQSDYDDYGIAHLISKYDRRYGDLWILKYALSLFRYYAKSIDLNYECLELDLNLDH